MQRKLLITLSLGLAACAGTAPLLTDQPQVDAKVTGGESESARVSQGAQVQGGSEEELREFAARALTYSYPGGPEGKTLILVGSLPEDLPLSLQLPEDSRIVGSIIRPGDGGTEMILDVRLRPEAVVTYFDDQFTQAGWELFEEAQVGAGFVAGSWPSATYCLEQDRGTIYLSTVPLTDEMTDVRIQLQMPAQYSTCDQSSYGPLDDGMRLIPELRSPPETTTQGGGGSSSGDQAEVTATLTTKLSAVELVAFYGDQLSEADWQLLEQGKGSRVAWSAWTFVDDEERLWHGVLLAFESPVVQERRSLSFAIQRGE